MSNKDICCDNQDNLEYARSASCWPYEIWYCRECNKEYSVELTRDFDNKEDREEKRSKQ